MSEGINHGVVGGAGLGGSVSGMSEGINHGVVGGAGLGEESREKGYEGDEGGLVEEKSLYSNSHVRGPANDPECDVEDGNLSDSHLCALSLGSATKRSDIHLLSLRRHDCFVCDDSLHDEEVEVDDRGQRDDVRVDEDENAEGTGVPVL